MDFLALTEIHGKPVKMAAVVRRRTRAITSQSVSFWVKKARRCMDQVRVHATTPDFAHLHIGAWDDKGECIAPCPHGTGSSISSGSSSGTASPARHMHHSVPTSPAAVAAAAAAAASAAASAYHRASASEYTPEGSPGRLFGDVSMSVPRRDLFASGLLPSAAVREASLSRHSADTVARHARRRSSSSASSVGSIGSSYSTLAGSYGLGLSASLGNAATSGARRARLSSTTSLPASLGVQAASPASPSTAANAVALDLMGLGLTWSEEEAGDTEGGSDAAKASASHRRRSTLLGSEAVSVLAAEASPSPTASLAGPSAEDLKALLCDVNGGMYVGEPRSLLAPGAHGHGSGMSEMQWTTEASATLWDADMLGDPFAPLDAWLASSSLTSARPSWGLAGATTATDGPVWLC